MTVPLPVRLLCGADPDELLEQVAERPEEGLSADRHRCVYCQAAMAEFARLWAPLRAAAAEQIRAPETLVGVVLEQVRGLLQTSDWAVFAQGSGYTRIALKVVVKVVRRAAAAVPGFRVLLPAVPTAATRSEETQSGRRTVRVSLTGTSVVVAVTVAANYDFDLRALRESLTSAVSADIEWLLGLNVGAVTVHLDDDVAA